MMRDSIIVKDDFCEHPELARQSALSAGFGTWAPNKGIVGSSIYEGMGFKGLHAVMLRALHFAIGRPIFPNSMFFRVTKPGTERAYIHSDLEDGHMTCIVYLSQHAQDGSGTGFYRHRATGLLEMPPFLEMEGKPEFDVLKRDMTEGGEAEWELTDFVRGHFNRALIFHAPLFHARHPLNGLGDGRDETARMIWACHFFL